MTNEKFVTGFFGGWENVGVVLWGYFFFGFLGCSKKGLLKFNT